jgi:hypothetical protein
MLCDEVHAHMPPQPGASDVPTPDTSAAAPARMPTQQTLPETGMLHAPSVTETESTYPDSNADKRGMPPDLDSVPIIEAARRLHNHEPQHAQLACSVIGTGDSLPGMIDDVLMWAILWAVGSTATVHGQCM